MPAMASVLIRVSVFGSSSSFSPFRFLDLSSFRFLVVVFAFR
jgi:hypothetical protein